VDDAEDEQDLVVGDEVVHDPVVADAEPVEDIGLAADRFDLLAADAAGFSCGLGELFEAGADPLTQRRRKLLERALGGRREPDLAGVAQAMSRSEVVRPRR
jgi:hypothetical protein